MASSTSTRQESVRRTDDAVFSALETAVAQGGWDSVTASGVARGAGVTVGAIYARAESMSELANLAWSRSLGPRFLEALHQIVRASRDTDAYAFDRAITRFDAYAKSAAPAMELAVASLFDDELDEVVGKSVRTGFGEIVFAPGESRHKAACATLVLAYFCGRIMARSRRPRMSRIDDAGRSVLRQFWTMSPVEFTNEEGADLVFLRHVDEAPLTPLHRATIDVISRYGYRRGTVARIARRAGVTPGAVLPRGGSKANLIADAAEALVMSPRAVWETYLERRGEPATGVARAEFVRALLAPDHARYWRLSLEFARVAEKVDELAVFRTPRDVLQETHQGLMFVGCFAERLDNLPYLGPFQAGTAT